MTREFPCFFVKVGRALTYGIREPIHLKGGAFALLEMTGILAERHRDKSKASLVQNDGQPTRAARFISRFPRQSP